ncbi:MAG: adenylate/guanylate cyclase domain-containing protein [Opitutus sp.]|nr:adenylate/guanylate cyclase domain-containing protein [Opitutus sp.]MCS6247589.1 adenylate/guanylate cyclase domain-containing protein [Opitutus sp.]MCS6274039.1 adenylate/guanylate cyclase domain-containing protein [Opitutus sp.]MCS6276496.1 adenylate/guanylate cyclase domain-containing protein [Opitutus sp.]MCS6301856.1 adenylate/guanylate cyclase domain-containing protein [Opitutus sp.]
MAYKKSILASASEDRLEKLIAERIKPDSDKKHIDARIWDLFGEEWCVMFTDLSGFSRNVAQFGVIHFLQTIAESHRLLIPIIEDHDGILLKTEGDSFLVIFRNPPKALTASIQMNKALATYNQNRTPEEHVLLGVGLGFGRVLRIGDSDVFGAEVNAASKLGEDTAKAYEILVTEAAYQALSTNANLGVSFELLAEAPTGFGKAYKVQFSRT